MTTQPAFDAESLYGPLFAGWTSAQCEQHARGHYRLCCRELPGPLALVDRPGCGLMTVSYIRPTDTALERRP